MKSLGENPLKSLVSLIFEYFRQLFMTKQGLILENLMLRQQLNIYKRKNKRPKLENIDRIILVWISRIFSNWKLAFVVVKVSTLIGWHKKGFKLYWKGNLEESAGLISIGNLQNLSEECKKKTQPGLPNASKVNS